MQANRLLPRHGQQSEGILIAKVLLHQEREPAQIFQVPQVIGMRAGRVECLLVVRHIVVSVPQRPLQPPQLQCLELIDTGALDGFVRFFV